MKHFSLLLSISLTLSSCFLNADSTLQNQEVLVASYLQDLEELGYCVIPNVFSESETKRLYERVWHEFVEKAWPHCKIDDRSNWKETFPIQNKFAIFAGPAGQTQVMWDLRQDPRIIDVFARIWNTKDLIVSMDGISLMCPPEIREFQIEPFPHVDQSIKTRGDGMLHNNNSSSDFVSESSLKTGPYTIQGQFLFEDSFEGDGGFYCIPKSHLRFTEFAPQLEALGRLEVPPEQNEEKWRGRFRYLFDFFDTRTDDSGNPYNKKQITAPRGSLILWDSRTVHWNQHPSKNRNEPRVRMVGYVCYVPSARLNDKGKVRRREAFEKGVSTGHNPAWPELKYSKEHIQPGFEEYLEDPSYAQPAIALTPLGRSLLGF